MDITTTAQGAVVLAACLVLVCILWIYKRLRRPANDDLQSGDDKRHPPPNRPRPIVLPAVQIMDGLPPVRIITDDTDDDGGVVIK